MSDDDIELIGTEWKVHASEKISTGDYENAEFHTTLSGEIGEPEPTLDHDTRVEIKAKLLGLHKELQATVERAAENRLREPGHEDWSVTGEVDEDV